MFYVNVRGFTMVMEVLGLVFSVIGAFFVFFVFLAKKNENRYTGRLEKLYEFLNFRVYIIEDVLRFFYILAACLCTGIGLFMALTVVELTKGLVLLVGGNLAVRMVFEFLMMVVKACRNLGEIGKQEKHSAYIEEETEIPVIYERGSSSVTEPKEEYRQPEQNLLVQSKEEPAPEEKAVKKKIIIKKEQKEPAEAKTPKYKICPSCGEKCSSKFAFCNMCGNKL